MSFSLPAHSQCQPARTSTIKWTVASRTIVERGACAIRRVEPGRAVPIDHRRSVPTAMGRRPSHRPHRRPRALPPWSSAIRKQVERFDPFTPDNDPSVAFVRGAPWEFERRLLPPHHRGAREGEATRCGMPVVATTLIRHISVADTSTSLSAKTRAACSAGWMAHAVSRVKRGPPCGSKTAGSSGSLTDPSCHRHRTGWPSSRDQRLDGVTHLRRSFSE